MTKEHKPTQAKEQQVALEHKQLAEALAEVENTKQQLLEGEDKYLRLCAEFDNFRKRSELEKSEQAKFAAKNFIEAILPVLDSFEHSKSVFEKKQENLDEIRKGFALIHKQFEDILLKFGVTKIEAKGQSFNPHYHEAVMQQESDLAPQTVLEELQPGFMLHDKLLRPAMVIVAKSK